MKKNLKLLVCGLGLFALGGIGLGLTVANTIEPNVVYAEDEEPAEPTEPTDPTDPEPEEPEVVEYPCHVVIVSAKHGSVTTDIVEGNVGDICTITAKHDLLYKIESCVANNVILEEDADISGKFTFALIEGENTISVKFVVDEELCGALTKIVEEAADKDWTRLFTVENAITIVKWLLDGGILIALIRYYVKDKRLEKKLEEKVQTTINGIIPETTKNTVLKTVEEVITPMFVETKADYIQLMGAMNVFAKCMALAQEGTVDSKRAILDELSGLKIGDLETLGEVRKSIEEMVERQTKAYEETLAAIKALGEKNAEYIGEKKVEEPSIDVEEPKVDEEQTKQAIE